MASCEHELSQSPKIHLKVTIISGLAIKQKIKILHNQPVTSSNIFLDSQALKPKVRGKER